MEVQLVKSRDEQVGQDGSGRGKAEVLPDGSQDAPGVERGDSEKA